MAKGPTKKPTARKTVPKKSAPKTKQGSAAPFVWYELVSSNPKSAKAFYKSVLGWSASDPGTPGVDYTIFSAKERMVAGMLPLTKELASMGVPVCWTGYVGVPDPDAMVKRIVAAGGSIKRDCMDIPGARRFAVVADPQGGVFIIFTPLASDPNAPVSPGTHGHVGWHELYTSNLDEAFKFYAKLFGWKKARDHDMGAMGPYRIFAVDGADAGGMMRKPPHIPLACWTYYFNVDALDAALAKVTKGKGKVLLGPMQVPGDRWVAQCTDPQGAHFALVSAKR